jgi:ABC-type lipoprotein export system ATPase subunit
MIRIADVTKVYGKGGREIRAADGVSLEIGAGEAVVLTGPSGAGKTTLLNLVGGMTRPDRGEIRVAGRDILAMGDAALSRLRARTIGFVFQFQSMLDELTALDNVRLPRRFAGFADDESLARSLLERVGLGDWTGAFAHELSEGQKRRVGLARALVNRPALLLADEPTADLDPDSRQVVLDLLAEAVREGATILLTTHDMGLNFKATRALRMEAGTVTDV